METPVTPAPPAFAADGTYLKGSYLGSKVLRSKSDPTRFFGIVRVDDGQQTHEILTDSEKVGDYYDKLEVGDAVMVPIRISARNDNRGQALVSISEVTAKK